jgi:YVTN family beta-propeller protein
VPCTTASWLGSVTPSFFFPICLVMLMAAVAVNRLTNKIYAANSGSNTVTIIDGSANSTSTFSVGSAPEALSLNPVTNKVYVANRCGTDALWSNQNRFQSQVCRGKPCGRVSCRVRYLAVSLGYFRLVDTTFPLPGSDPSGYFYCMGVLRNVVWCFEPDRPAKCHPNATRVAWSPCQRPVLIPGGY